MISLPPARHAAQRPQEHVRTCEDPSSSLIWGWWIIRVLERLVGTPLGGATFCIGGARGRGTDTWEEPLSARVCVCVTRRRIGEGRRRVPRLCAARSRVRGHGPWLITYGHCPWNLRGTLAQRRGKLETREASADDR